MEDAFSVDAFHLNRRVEIEDAVHIPRRIENARAKAGLELACCGTGTFVDLHMSFAVNKPKNVITGDGVATLWKDIHADGALGYDTRYLFVEVLIRHEQFLAHRVRRPFFLFASDEGYKLLPPRYRGRFFLIKGL